MYIRLQRHNSHSSVSRLDTTLHLTTYHPASTSIVSRRSHSTQACSTSLSAAQSR